MKKGNDEMLVNLDELPTEKVFTAHRIFILLQILAYTSLFSGLALVFGLGWYALAIGSFVCGSLLYLAVNHKSWYKDINHLVLLGIVCVGIFIVIMFLLFVILPSLAFYEPFRKK